MRVALAKLSAAYVVVAGVFGCTLLLTPNSGEARVNNARSWIELVELRLNPPPDSITIAIAPWAVPLRRATDDTNEPLLRPTLGDNPDADAVKETPLAPEVMPVAPMPRALPPVKVRRPQITLFATAEPLSPLGIEPETQAEVGARAAQAADRLHTNLSRDLYANFDLFLYVSKSADGPLSQHMYVFAKERGKDKKTNLTLLRDWPVSTGREDAENDIHGLRQSTATPAGYYQLDPRRFYRRYTSFQWGKPMPNSMFFDWTYRGYRTGLAIHGVSDTDEIDALGSRASGGCVHLSPDAAAELFDLVRSDYKGMVPRFAYDRETKTISNQGKLSRDRNGALRMVEGYRALVVIENYGGQPILSELSLDTLKPEG